MLVFSFFIALAIFSNVATAFVLQPRPESYKFVHKFSFLNKKSDLMPYNKPMALASNPLDQLFNSDVFQEPATSDAKLNRSPTSSFGKNQKIKDYTKLKHLLGGKGANLAQMGTIGLTIPPGFTITTEVCDAFNRVDKKLPKSVWPSVLKSLELVENEMERKFGDPEKPLLVSVRSGAAISMPGMMDTVLNLGLNDDTVKGLSKNFGERFAMDSYRRFLNMFGDVVMDIPHSAFEEVLTSMKKRVGVKTDNELSVEHLKTLVEQYKEVYVKHGKKFLTDPMAQLYAAIIAVFNSWSSDRAVRYREAEGITGLLGTAVNVQAMVFGNMGETSGTGVCFSRNPISGQKELYGEYLINAQGEDVVAGIRTPKPISTLKEVMPHLYDELLGNIEKLEKNLHDMQDIEFTIQEGKLYMLQTRNGKRVGTAAVKIAVDMVEEGLATTDQAVSMVKPEHLNQLLHPQFKDITSQEYKSSVVATGLPASPGAAVGKIVFTPEEAEAAFASGEKCVLVRDETSPEDVGGMWAAEGVLTARGGMTSHAAVVARGWGKPCISGCEALHINEKDGVIKVHQADGKESITLKKGDWISLNGNTGEVVQGKQGLNPPSIGASKDTMKLMDWVDEKRTIKILANADTPADAREARKNGAQGIGLCRTEHMFFSEDRIRVVRRMILSKSAESRKKALNDLLPLQRGDFEGILEAMDGLPVTVRLLDPPLHEFLPHPDDIDDAFAKDVGMSKAECIDAIQKMREVNPMLGLRGCRLGVVLPDLIEMQARALIEAALNNKFNKKLDPHLEIMVPLIGSASEFTHQSKLIRQTAQAVFKERNQQIEYKVGTMIEVPRAALTAKEIAEAGVDFFSYGTNDLTQMTFGFSRDDIGSFLPVYLKSGLLEQDPFQVVDEKGVGALIKSSLDQGRKYTKNPNFKAGVCGEHGGDPKSVNFFVRNGLNYVSCSPFRVPVARLAAAQSAIDIKNKKK